MFILPVGLCQCKIIIIIYCTPILTNILSFESSSNNDLFCLLCNVMVLLTITQNSKFKKFQTNITFESVSVKDHYMSD